MAERVSPPSSTSRPPVSRGAAAERHLAIPPPPAEPAARARCVARTASVSAGRDAYPEGRCHRFFLPAASVPRRAARATGAAAAAAALLPKPGACRRQEGSAARLQQAAEKCQHQHPHRAAGASAGSRHAAPGSGTRSLPGPHPPPLPWPPCHSGVGPGRRASTPPNCPAGLFSKAERGLKSPFFQTAAGRQPPPLPPVAGLGAAPPWAGRGMKWWLHRPPSGVAFATASGRPARPGIAAASGCPAAGFAVFRAVGSAW